MAEYSPDMVWKAQELYVIDRLPFAKVAERTGVTATTLKSWAKKFQWKQKREEIAQIEAESKMDLYRSRQKAIKMLLESGDGKECSQMAFAVSSLENLALKQQELQQSLALNQQSAALKDQSKKAKVISKDDAYKQLGQAVEGRLQYVMQNPQAITTKNIQDVLNMLKLMEQVAPAEKEENKPKQNQGIDKELAENIRKALNLVD